MLLLTINQAHQYLRICYIWEEKVISKLRRVLREGGWFVWYMPFPLSPVAVRTNQWTSHGVRD